MTETSSRPAQPRCSQNLQVPPMSITLSGLGSVAASRSKRWKRCSRRRWLSESALLSSAIPRSRWATAVLMPAPGPGGSSGCRRRAPLHRRGRPPTRTRTPCRGRTSRAFRPTFVHPRPARPCRCRPAAARASSWWSSTASRGESAWHHDRRACHAAREHDRADAGMADDHSARRAMQLVELLEGDEVDPLGRGRAAPREAPYCTTSSSLPPMPAAARTRRSKGCSLVPTVTRSSPGEQVAGEALRARRAPPAPAIGHTCGSRPARSVRALSESSSIRVRLSTYTVGTPWMRPIQANGTARPAPVVRMADGRSLRITRQRQRAGCAAGCGMLRFVGPWAWTTRSSASSERVSDLSKATQTRSNAPTQGAGRAAEAGDRPTNR